MVPFVALVDDHDRFLVETTRFTYLTSGRDLLRLQEATPSREAALVLAAPDFDMSDQPRATPPVGATANAADKADKERGGVDFNKVRFTPLPGTAGEARALAGIISGAKILTGPQATKTALMAAAGPAIVHVATHGFFLEDAPQASNGKDRGLKLESETNQSPIQYDDPLLRAGLAFAGANRRDRKGDDKYSHCARGKLAGSVGYEARRVERMRDRRGRGEERRWDSTVFAEHWFLPAPSLR